MQATPSQWTKPETKSAMIHSQVRTVFGDTAFCSDWLPEQGGLEPSVSREVFSTENPREYWRNFAQKSINIAQRMVRLRFGTSSVANLEFRCRENAAGSSPAN